MEIRYSADIREKFPELRVDLLKVETLEIIRGSPALEDFKKEVVEEIKSTYDLDNLKDNETFRKYRDFFWTIGIDPTKIRPASEALIRRILQGKTLPKINTGVDAYNLASAKSGIPLAAFDATRIEGGLTMGFAEEDEEFLGIGMKEPKILQGKEVVVEDGARIVAIYPYRDADHSKITNETHEILLMACGVPGIPWEKVEDAGRMGREYLERFCRD